MDSSSSFDPDSSIQKDDKRFKSRKVTRFSQEVLNTLQQVFEQEPYPASSDIIDLADRFKESRIRIREWFRAQRKKDFLGSKRITKKKKVFERPEIKILWECYRRNKYPSQDEFNEIAEQLNCQVKNVKNWYFYRRRHSYNHHEDSKAIEKPIVQSCNSINEDINNMKSTQASEREIKNMKQFETFLTSSNSNSIVNQETNKKPEEFSENQSQMPFLNMQNPILPPPNSIFLNTQQTYVCIMVPMNTINQQNMPQAMPFLYSNFQNVSPNTYFGFNNGNRSNFVNNVFFPPNMMPFSRNLYFNDDK